MEERNDLILITGASGGLGRQVTQYLLRSGWRNVVCHFRSRCEEIADLLRREDLDPAQRLVQADLTDEAQVVGMRERIEANWGPVYGLVNLAGGSTNRISWKLSAAEFQSILNQNLLTTFLACREFVPSMRQKSRGRIVNVSSVVAYAGAPGASHYCAAKAGILGFSRALALEVADRQIAVSAVALGYFQYGLIESIPEAVQEQIKSRIPAQRFGAGDEAGGLIAYLLGESGGYCNGQVYHLNGGLYA